MYAYVDRFACTTDTDDNAISTDINSIQPNRTEPNQQINADKHTATNHAVRMRNHPPNALTMSIYRCPPPPNLALHYVEPAPWLCLPPVGSVAATVAPPLARFSLH